MGERQNRPFHFTFNTSLKVGFHGSRITSDAGLLPVRTLYEQLGFGQLISDNLKDERRGKNTLLHGPLQHSAERQKGNPSPETFLRQPLFFGDSRQRLFQTLNRLLHRPSPYFHSATAKGRVPSD